MTARKAAILLPRIYARLLIICGGALPVDWFILPAVFKEFLELPRLRKALSVVRNKRRVFARKPSSAPKPAVLTHGSLATKGGAVVKSHAGTVACGQ